MGKTGIRLIKKIARVEPVAPTVGYDGVEQPAYLRSPSAVQSAQGLKDFHRCVANKMRGQKFTGQGRPAVWKAFADAAKECKLPTSEKKKKRSE